MNPWRRKTGFVEPVALGHSRTRWPRPFASTRCTSGDNSVTMASVLSSSKRSEYAGESLMAHTITLIPGDGIGPEVATATQRVLAASGVVIDWEIQEAGAA